jgi:ABC-type phosphate transport system auxiliary subunit
VFLFYYFLLFVFENGDDRPCADEVLRNELISRVDEEAKMEQEIVLLLKNEIEKQRNEINELKNRNRELEKKNTDFERENTELKKKNLEQQNEVNGLKRKIAELENEFKRKNLCSASSSSSTDTMTPLLDLIVPNPQGKFKLEGRNIIFEGNYNRSLILKDEISDGILEVFVLC